MPRTLISLLALAVLLAVGAAWSLLGDDAPRDEPASARPTAGTDDTATPGALPTPGARDPDASPLDVSGLVPTPPPAPDEAAAPGVLTESAWIRGRVVDPDGLALEGEPLLLLLERDPWAHDDSPHALQGGATSGDVLGRARSDADGNFELPARAGARHRLRAGGRAAAPQSLSGVYAGADLLLVLEPGVELRGHVVSEETGEAVPGAHVGALAGAQHLLTRADAEGGFRLAPLPEVDHLYGAWAPGFGVLNGVLVPGDEELLIELPPARDVPGQVLERETNRPVPDALVRLTLDIEARLMGSDSLEQPEQRVHEMQTRTDVDGRFVFVEAPTRGFVLDVEAEGYLPGRFTAYQNRELREGESAAVSLMPAEPLLARVVDGETQRALADVHVELRVEGAQVAEARSDAAGLAELPTAAITELGQFRLRARDERGYGAYARTSMKRDETLLELVEPARLVLLATLDGAPLAGAEVAVLSDAPPTLGRTGADGLVELLHERAGPDDDLRVQARHEGRQSLAVSVPWPPESDEPVELALDGGLSVSGLVVDAFGEPVPAARLWSNFAPGGHSGPDGSFLLAPVEPDTSGVLFATAEGFRRAVLPDVWAGDEDVLLTLEPELRLRGRVLHAGSFEPADDFGGRLQRERLVDGNWVFADQSSRLRPDRADPGAFHVTLPEAGRYRVRVTRAGSLETFSVPVDFDGRTEPPELEVLLSPAAVLELLVEDSRGAPVPGLRITLVDWEQHLARRKPAAKGGKKPKKAQTWNDRTDDEGRARFQLGEGGHFALRLPELDDAYGAPFYVWPGPPAEQSLRLGPTGDLLVSVRDEAGLPVPSMRVRVRSLSGGDTSRSETVRTAEDQLLIATLLPDAYVLTVEARGFDTQQRKVSVIGDLTQSVDVVMHKGGGGSSGFGGGRRGGRGGRGGVTRNR